MSDFEFDYVIFCAEEWEKISEKQYHAKIDGASVVFTTGVKKEKFFYYKDTILVLRVDHYFSRKSNLCTTIPDRIMRKELVDS